MVMLVVGIGIILNVVFLVIRILTVDVAQRLPLFYFWNKGFQVIGSLSLFLILGILLTYFGARSVRRFRMIVRNSVRMLNERNYIDIKELCGKLKMSEIQIRKYIRKAKTNCDLPFKTDLK
jgi:membrane protein implicated in regulation of membrane protease activity